VLILESSITDPSGVRRLQADCGDDAECFVRDDAMGAIVVCSTDEITARAGGVGRRVQVLFTGGRHGTDGGPWLFYVGLWTPDDYRAEFLAWYRWEHMPILLENPLWDGCRFVQEKTARGAQFYALHQLADKAALDSPERRHSRSTPWFRRLSEHAWFDGAFKRTLCRRLDGPAKQARTSDSAGHALTSGSHG